MAPPPLPADEHAEEALVRVPAEEPARAAASAGGGGRQWSRLVMATGGGAAAASSSRLLGPHTAAAAAPRMMGILCSHRVFGIGNGVAAPAPAAAFTTTRFVPTASTFLPPVAAEEHRGFLVHDACHGRVLLRPYPCRWNAFGLIVWNPITGERTRVTRPPRFARHWKAAVFCSAGGACDHRDCHSGPFTVVYLASHDRLGMIACIYMSEVHQWGQVTCIGDMGVHGLVSRERAAFAGNALHFKFGNQNTILKLDLATWRFFVIQLPFLMCDRMIVPWAAIGLTTMEDGRLGFAVVQGSRLCVWSMDDTETGWLLCHMIDLPKVLPASTAPPRLVGIAEGVGVAFVSVGNAIFTVDLKSDRVKKVYEGLVGFPSIIPYVNFCTQVIGVPSSDDASRAGGSINYQSSGANDLLSKVMRVSFTNDGSRVGGSNGSQPSGANTLLRQGMGVPSSNVGSGVGGSNGAQSSVPNGLPSQVMGVSSTNDGSRADGSNGSMSSGANGLLRQGCEQVKSNSTEPVDTGAVIGVPSTNDGSRVGGSKGSLSSGANGLLTQEIGVPSTDDGSRAGGSNDSQSSGASGVLSQGK